MQDTQNKEVKQDSQRKSCVFYRSFFEAIEGLPKKHQLNLYRSIFKYSLDFQEPELNGLEVMAWTLIRPQLDANIIKWQNGCKGGEHGIKGKEHGKKGGRRRINNPPKYPPKNGANIPPENPRNVECRMSNVEGNQRFLKDLKENEASHASWAEGLYMQLGLKPGKLAELLVGFSGHLQTLSKVHTTLEEFKQHFRNWLFTEDRNRRLEEHKRPKAGML